MQNTILLVDDEPAIVQALASELRLQGYHVHTASSGKDGLAIIEKNKVDILITDLRMPGMDGLELLSRTTAINNELQAIVLTGYGDMQNAVEALNRGASGYMLKPPDLKELSIHIENCLRRSALNRELRDKNEALENEIQLRRQAEVSLIQAKEAAEHANRAKSTFLANMSHEIRTPMTAIIGLSDLAIKAQLSPKVRDYLNKIKTASYSLLNLINDILDVSKIEAGHLHLDVVPFDLEEMFDRLADVFKKPAADKGLELVQSLPRVDACHLEGDPIRLEQVLINLVGNAIKFTHEGEIVLKAVVSEEEDPNRFVLTFSVSDTGIGMDKDKIPTLFNAFIQEDGSTTRNYGGTGLGLTISRHIVEMMGGTLQVDSEQGKGSCFYFTIVLGRCEEAARHRAILPKDIQGMRVLVCDDSPIALETLKSDLKMLRLDPVLVDSGSRCLEELDAAAEKEQPFPLVLMDWRMPKMDGIETTGKILQRPNPPKIVMLTAFGRDEIMQRATESGVHAFLTKPATRSLLLETILHVFNIGSLDSFNGGGRNVGKDDPPCSFLSTRVLLVEDNSINQQLLQEILENIGITIEIANNGLEAVQQVRQSVFDLILMDIQMPKMDGYTATRRIRDLGGFEKLPIIAMTAYAMEGDRQRCLEAGMNDHVSKPIDKRQLYKALMKWIPVAQQSKAKVSSDNQSLAWSLRTLPEKVPGIVLAVGLERIDHNEKLYRTLLYRFANEFSETTLLVKAGMEGKRNEDLTDACHLLHTVRGISGNLGAMDLTKAASALEEGILEDRRHDWPDLFQDFSDCLSLVLQSINELQLKQSKDGQSLMKNTKNAPMDIAEAKAFEPLLRELSVSIENKRFKAAVLLENMKSMVHDPVALKMVAALESDLARFDFESAGKRLKTFIDVMGATLREEAAS